MDLFSSSSLWAVPLVVRIPAVQSSSEHHTWISRGGSIQQKLQGSFESAWVSRSGHNQLEYHKKVFGAFLSTKCRTLKKQDLSSPLTLYGVSFIQSLNITHLLQRPLKQNITCPLPKTASRKKYYNWVSEETRNLHFSLYFTLNNSYIPGSVKKEMGESWLPKGGLALNVYERWHIVGLGEMNRNV